MAHNVPENLRYTEEHEWALLEGEIITIGITDFAQSSLGDIVFVELPESGATLTKAQAFGVVESIKSVSDLYSPVSGSVTEVNNSLEDSPESINETPYESWMIKIKMDNPSDFDSLLTHDAYTSFCENQ